MDLTFYFLLFLICEQLKSDIQINVPGIKYTLNHIKILQRLLKSSQIIWRKGIKSNLSPIEGGV